ncbi:CAP domain-containing protein [Crystallibacter crystallopoietes]|nr:CAP domain-containing protein [Arthrobacter crystallopoietes]
MGKVLKPFTALAVTLLLLFVGLSPAAAITRTSSDPVVKEILGLVNKYRADNGLSRVVWNQSIGNVAQEWAEVQNTRINKGTYSLETIHREGYGTKQIPAGYDYGTEIIAYNKTPKAIVDWWMSSPVHRSIVLSPKATDIGIGYMQTTKAGWYGQYFAVANVAGYPTTRSTLPPHPSGGQSSAAGDVHEGDMAAVDAWGNLYVYPSAQGGDLWRRDYISAGWQGASEVDVADWNSDGVQDIVAKWSSGRLTVNFGRAAGGFDAAFVIGGSGWAGYDILVADWKQGDNYPALIAKNTANGRLYYYPNPSGTKHGARKQIGTGWGSLEILALDFDADSRTDIVAKTSSGQLKLYRGNGSSGFISEARRVVGRSGWQVMHHFSAIHDHLGDGRPGILARDRYGNLHHYPVAGNRIGSRVTVGYGGWDTLLLGS